MKTNRNKLIRAFLIALSMIATVKSFAQGQANKHSIDKSQTEARVQVNCNCAISKVKNEEDLKKLNKLISEHWDPPYYKDLKVREYLNESSAKDLSKYAVIESSINKGLMNLTMKQQEDLLSLGLNTGTTEGKIKVALGEIIANVSNIPAVKEITDKYIVTVEVNGKVDERGAQLAQVKSVTLEPRNPKKQELKGKLTYTKCDNDKAFLDLGHNGGCWYQQKVSGKFEKNLVGNLFTGGDFSSPDFSSKRSQGSFFILLKF